MFRLRKDIGLSELIAFGALVVSGLAFWQTTKSSEAFIVLGGGPVQVATGLDAGHCTVLAALPISFHNSGKKAVSLESLAPAESVEPVLFSQGNKFLDTEAVSYKLYRSPTAVGPVPDYWANDEERMGEFTPSYSQIGYLLPPAEGLRFFIVLEFNSSKSKIEGTDIWAHVAIDALFSNGQKVPIRTAFHIEPEDPDGCS